MKYYHMILICCGLMLSACSPSSGPESALSQSATSNTQITTRNHTVNGMHEVMKLEVNGKEVVALLEWRNYSNATDANVSVWYGDMRRPPAKYVVKKLAISVEGKEVNIPASHYRYLASQWMNDVKSLGAYKSGEDLNIYVDVGDGSEGWTASYIIHLDTGALVSHKMYEGPEFHNQF